MAGEQVEGLPEELREWVLARSEETGRSSEEVLARAVTIAKLLDEYDGDLADGDADPITNGEGAIAASGALTDRIAEVEAAVADLDSELDEKIDDVRSRVIQVKRETDAKADADHDHSDLREGVESASATAAGLDDDLAELRADLEELEETFEDGFANYEDVLEYLTDAADEHDSKLSTLASVLADLRTTVSNLRAREAQRRAAAELQAEANRLGVAAASCAACGSKVRLGLLSSPECPHCGGTFESVEPASGFFDSPSLAVGRRPALEGETTEETTAEDIFDEA